MTGRKSRQKREVGKEGDMQLREATGGAGKPWWSWDDLSKIGGGKVRDAHEEKLVE